MLIKISYAKLEFVCCGFPELRRIDFFARKTQCSFDHGNDDGTDIGLESLVFFWFLLEEDVPEVIFV